MYLLTGDTNSKPVLLSVIEVSLSGLLLVTLIARKGKMTINIPSENGFLHVLRVYENILWFERRVLY